METILEPGELLTAVLLPPPGTSSAYVKHRLRGIDTAIVGVAVSLVLSADGLTCESAGIGLAGAGTTPLRASGAEAALTGRALTSEAWAEAGRVAAEECEPLEDTEASEWYRRKMVERFVQRAGALAQTRAKGQEELSA
jgi:carbon-monoxide dehydrogenase medium subunit